MIPSGNRSWAIILIRDNVIREALDYIDQDQEDVLAGATELALQNGYEYGRSDARDILQNDGRLVVGENTIHVCVLE